MITRFLREQFIDRDELNSAATFKRLLAGVFISEAKLESADEEAAETAFIPRGAAQRFILKQMLKEGLGEVLGIANGEAAPA